MRFNMFVLAAFAATGLAESVAAAPASVEYYHVAPSFVGETINDQGFVTGFTAPNPWGQYTAYIMSTNAKGQRTWRIEHDLPNPGGQTAQGSSIYLLEGRDRALLIDTGNPSKHTAGVDDLKSVVRFLLGHDNQGQPIAHPLDFVLANTHSHDDHIGENAEFSDRTVYYMDLDWPETAPANYVPIREGGGKTAHGSGAAVGEIDLGDRKVTAIAMPPHTPGSTGYLDADNQMLFSGDALGSGYVWLQWAPISVYQTAVHHVLDVVKAYPDLKVFGAHFYQYRQGKRAEPPINGRPADLRYVRDEATAADELLSGKAIGVPYFWRPNSYIAGHGSGQIVYSLDNLYAPGVAPTAPYHAVQLHGDDAPAPLAGLKANLLLITGPHGESLYLLKGSKRALLIDTGSGGRGLKAFLKPLVGVLPLAVVLTDSSPDQTGGLRQLHPAAVYRSGGRHPSSVDLGSDLTGRPMHAEIIRFGNGLSVVETSNQLAFVGDRLGGPNPAKAWVPKEGLSAYRTDVTQWNDKTHGRYTSLYTGHSVTYYTPPSLVDDTVKAVDAAIASGASTITVTPH